MRGADGYTESMFTMSKLDDFIPANHPLRPIRLWLNEALTRMDTVFSRMYESEAKGGRPSIAPEKLIRTLLLQVLYSIRSERMLMEQISYNMLFRWFVGLAMDDAVWDHSTFSKNRDRLMVHDVIVSLFNETVETARVRGVTCRVSTSASTARSFRRGRDTRALCPGRSPMTTRRLTVVPALRRTGAVRSAATTHMNPARTLRRDCSARVVARARCFATWVVC